MTRWRLALFAALVTTSCAGSPTADVGPDRGPPVSPPAPIGAASTSTSAAAEGSTATADPTTTPTTSASTTSRAATTNTETTTTTSTPTTSTPTTSTPTTSTITTTTLPTTSCTDVAHISDSTGIYLWDAQYVDGAANTMGERYRSVGVERWIDDSSGGRSVRERVAGWQTNALEAADAIRRSGFRGCWVVMIGTNDAANVAAGANLGYEGRILQMLYVMGGDPVLWVDAATNRSETAYRNDNMRAWNETLERVADEHENLRVLRWSERVRPEWFVADGVHMGTEGRIWRAASTAGALVEFFPG